MLSLRKIPLKNIKCHPVRTLILLVLTFAQAACLFGGMMMLSAIRQELSLAQERLGADLLVYPTAAVSKISAKKLLMQGTPVEVYRDRSILSRMDSCDGIAQISWQTYLSDTLPSGDRIWIVGYEPETDFVLTPWLEEGESLALSKGSLAVGSKVDLSDNNTVTLYQKEWPVAARLTETGSLLDSAVFVPMESLGDLIRASADAGIDTYKTLHPERDFSAALVRVRDKSRVESVTDWINIYIRKVTAVRSEESLTQTASGIQGTTKMMVFIVGLVWLILLFALGIAQSMLMKERRKELYVWHVLGASRGLISRQMLSEAFLIGLWGALLGLISTWLFFALAGKLILSGFTFSVVYGFEAALVSLILTVIAGLAAAWLSAGKTIRHIDGQMLLMI